LDKSFSLNNSKGGFIMAQNYFKVEKGLKITDVGSDTGVLHLTGAGAPDLDAPVGSIYSDQTAGGQYQKIAEGAGAENWKQLATKEDVAASIGTWRPERVVLVTNEFQAAGTRDVVASPFTDDQGTAVALADFVVGKHIVTDAAGTPALLKIDSVSGDEITLVAADNALVKDDTFVCEYYLPDIAAQENLAIVNFNGSVMVKIADADWGRADALALAPSYAAANGTVSSSDTVQSAIEKLDGNQVDLITLSGMAQGSEAYEVERTDYRFGADNENAIPYPATGLAAFQEINYHLSQLMLMEKSVVADGTFKTLVTLKGYNGSGCASKHIIKIVPQNTSAAIVCLELLQVCDAGVSGTPSSDFTVYGKLKLTTRSGSAVPSFLDYNPEFQMVVSGTGGEITAQLQIKLPSNLINGGIQIRSQMLSGWFA
jgi:hypothetical protein